MQARVITQVSELPPDFSLQGLAPMPFPRGVLLCAPDYFRVVDVKNPAMADHVGTVDSEQARQQWEALRRTLEGLGLEVEVLPPLEGREDMVFAANQTFSGLDASGARVCVPSHMKHPSRRLEVPAFESWFESRGYRIRKVGRPGWLFEGGGDAIWHPGRALIWGGHGHRTDPRIYPDLARAFGAPVFQLELVWDRFYHLDTCFCPLDEHTLLVFPGALKSDGMDLLRRVFREVIEVDESEAVELMACNATAFFGKNVVIQRGAESVNNRLRQLGYQVIEVETSEFLKSGGSVYCLKTHLF